MASPRIAVCLEVTATHTFASALAWPGWCRAGEDEHSALEALRRYADRYAGVADRAAISFPSTLAIEVVERVPGGPTTAFAAPECRRPFPRVTMAADRARITASEAGRMAALVVGAWRTFDAIAAASPPGLRKGPRGGGRDRDELVAHVLGAETAYARNVGMKLKRPAIEDRAAIEDLRAAIAAVLVAPSDGSPVVTDGWTTRYAARRIAWHVLEHGWEMQDRTEA